MAELRVARTPAGPVDLVNLVAPGQSGRIDQLADYRPFPLGRHAVEVEEVEAVGALVPVARGDGPQHLGIHHRPQGLEATQDPATGSRGCASELRHPSLEGVESKSDDDQVNQPLSNPLLDFHAQSR